MLPISAYLTELLILSILTIGTVILFTYCVFATYITFPFLDAITSLWDILASTSNNCAFVSPLNITPDKVDEVISNLNDSATLLKLIMVVAALFIKSFDPSTNVPEVGTAPPKLICVPLLFIVLPDTVTLLFMSSMFIPVRQFITVFDVKLTVNGP